MADFPPPPPPTRFQRCSQRNPTAPPQPVCQSSQNTTQQAAAALPQQERHPMDAAPAFWPDGVSLAANFVARADPRNGKVFHVYYLYRHLTNKRKRFMKQRTPDDDCLLCIEKKATQRNSHIISAALLKKAIGKRDYELSYKISTAELLIDEFHGKSRLDNPSTTIKQNPHSRDYYFCPECEKRMGHLESEVILSLTNCGDVKYGRNYSDFISPGGITYKAFNRLGSDEFNMFFLLTVWRIALLYRLEKNIHPLRGYGGHEMDLMRDILFWYLNGDVQNYERLKDQFAMMIFSAQSNSDPTRNFSMTIDFADRPNIFWAFDYLILLYSAKDIEEAPKGDDAYFLLKPDVELINTPPILPRIAFVEEDAWNDLVTSVLGFTSTGFFQSMLSKLVEATGLPKNFCHIIVYFRAKDIEVATGKLFSECSLIAFKEIMDTVNKDNPAP